MAALPNRRLKVTMTEDINQPLANEIEEPSTCCSNSSCCAPQAPVTRATPKVGRNDPCICGSKRKFRKCHKNVLRGVWELQNNLNKFGL